MAVILGVLAVVWGEVVVLLWAAGVGGIAVAATLWARSAWKGVSVKASFEPPRGFVGESIELVVRVANSKRTPLPIVRVVVRLPPGLLPQPDPRPTELRGHRRRISVAGRGEATLRLPVHATARGEYWLDGVDIELADPFDLVPLERSFENECSLLLMPEPRVEIPLRIRRRLPFGSPAPGQRLFEDPEHFAGVREYEPGDPMRHVHWRLSAHTGRLQTKRFEPARSAEVLFVLDVSRGEPFWLGVDRRAAEETIGWASYLARQAISAGWRTGLIANTHLARGRGPLRVPASTAPGSEAALFQALARMPNQPTGDLAPVMREVSRRLTRRTTFVVISPEAGPALLHELELLRRKGSEVFHLSPLEAREREAS